MDVVQTARRARGHLIRAAIATVVVAVAFGIGVGVGDFDEGYDSYRAFVAYACAVVVLFGGAVTVRALAAATRAGAEGDRVGERRTPLALIVTIAGYFVVVVLILGVLEVPMGSLLLGGALTGVALGIAAQQTLGNFFAGILLLVVRPFTVGDRVLLKSGLGEYEGIIDSMGLFYLQMTTSGGPVMLPNTAVIASAIGPGIRQEEHKAKEEEEEENEGEPEEEKPEVAADPSRKASEPA